MVELVALAFTSVELARLTVSRFVSVRLQGAVVVEFRIVELPVILSAVEEADVGI